MMGNFIEELIHLATGEEVKNQLSSKLGIEQNVAGEILPQITPLILGGLKKQMQNYGGEARVDHILNKYGSDSVLDNISGLFDEKLNDTSADPRLGGLLGDSGVQAANMLTNKFNLNGSTAMKLIPMLAPVILGTLTKKRDKDGAGSSGITALIDQDGDGNILDDVAGFLMSGLSETSSKSGGGLLGGLLGSFLGGRKK